MDLKKEWIMRRADGNTLIEPVRRTSFLASLQDHSRPHHRIKKAITYILFVAVMATLSRIVSGAIFSYSRRKR